MSFDVQWKVSISGGLAAVLEPQVPDGCSLTASRADLRRRRRAPAARRTLECPTASRARRSR